MEVKEGKAITCEGINLTPEQMEWIDNEGNKVVKSRFNSRVFTEERMLNDKALLVLFIRSVELKDEGTWTCRTKDLTLTSSFNPTVGESVAVADNETQSVKENSVAKIKCIILKGYPQPEIQWYKEYVSPATEIRQSEKGTFQKYTVKEEKPNLHVLYIRKVDYTDEGTYFCRATQTKLRHQKYMATKLEVLYKPVFIHPETKMSLQNSEESGTPYRIQHMYAVLNDTKNITCSVIANPPAKFKWVRINNRAETPVSQEMIIENTEDTSILSLNIQSLEDYGEYKCTASNSMGSTNLIFDVMRGERPLQPSEITFSADNSNRTHLSFTVICENCTFDEHPGEAGVFTNMDPTKLPLTGYSFELVPYVPDYIVNWDNSEEIRVTIASSNETVISVGPVANNTKYHVRVRSMNEAGFSDWLEYVFTDADHLPFTKHSVRLTNTELLLVITCYITLFF